jgi:hypothetical protein
MAFTNRGDFHTNSWFLHSQASWRSHEKLFYLPSYLSDKMGYFSVIKYFKISGASVVFVG